MLGSGPAPPGEWVELECIHPWAVQLYSGHRSEQARWGGPLGKGRNVEAAVQPTGLSCSSTG